MCGVKCKDSEGLKLKKKLKNKKKVNTVVKCEDSVLQGRKVSFLLQNLGLEGRSVDNQLRRFYITSSRNFWLVIQFLLSVIVTMKVKL